MSSAQGPLAGVKVLDLSSVIMGPFATQILASLGAEVTKLESPEGDNMRHVGPMRNPGMGHIFLQANQGKRSIVLDLKQPAARAAALRLAGQSDVLIARWAGRAVYGGLLRAGVRIFEYSKRILHAKNATADGSWYTVGTANIDHLSFFRNHEVNHFGFDPERASLFEAQVLKDFNVAEEIVWETWRKRSWLEKLRERVFFGMRVWL